MCQLTLFNFHKDFNINDPEIKSQLHHLLYITSVVNAREHGDGHGLSVFSKRSKKDIVLKSKKTGIIGNVIEELESKKISLTSPILFHVRKASATYKKEELLDENAHPFEGDNFVLAHNGTFSGELITAEKDKSIIDSRIFHKELEKNWAEKEADEDMIKVLQKTIDDFTGKMALIFRNKTDGEYYVVRNSRADLHKVDIKFKGEVVGYLINTEKFPIFNINNLAYRFTDFTFELKEEPKLIEVMSLFKVGEKDLEKVGNMSYTSTTTYPNNVARNRGQRNRAGYDATIHNSSGVDLSWVVKEFLPATKLSIPELNLLFTTMGFPLPYMKNAKEYKKAEKELKALFTKHYRKEKRKVLEEILTFGITPQEFHTTYAFPYFILETRELKKIKREVMNG